MSPVSPRPTTTTSRGGGRVRTRGVASHAAAGPVRRSARALVLAGSLAGVLAVAPAVAGAASPSKIVYECAPELCVADPDTGATASLTTDGAAVPYRFPSLSADGRRLAAARGNDVVVGAPGNLGERWTGSRDINDVALSPDGTAVAESHSYVENVFGCPFTGGCLKLVDRSATRWTRGVQGDGNTNLVSGGGGAGFLGKGGGALLTAFYTLDENRHTVCILPNPLGEEPPCPPAATEVGRALSAPAGSPDGKSVAAVRSVAGQPAQIVLYDATRVAEVRVLADGGSPTFSPDGSRVAFSDPRGGISIVSTAGGRPTRLTTSGAAPTWSAGPGPELAGASLAASSLRYRRGRVAVRVRCAGTATCRGTLRLRKGPRTLATRAYRVAAGKRATVALTPTATGRRTLERGRRHRVTVRLDQRGAARVTQVVTLRR